MKKIIFSLIVIFLFSSIPLIPAQLTIGSPAEQKMVKIMISEDGKVHVIHEIKKSNTVVSLNSIEGTLSNLNVTDIKGNEIQFGTTASEKTTGITIFPTKNNVKVEYDLDDVLFFKDGMWKWDFLYLQTTTIILPEGLDLVYVNNSPVLLQDAKGITCHGCDAKIEYVLNEKIKTQQIEWENRKFVIGIRTLDDLSPLFFNQPTKSISFNVKNDDQLVTLIIPLELLWNPYEVYLDGEKILKREFFSNQTHAWLNFRPMNAGTIQIIGTTVVPEFPIIAPLVIGIAGLIILQLKNRINLH